MKTPQMDVYAVTRHYLNDNAHHLSDELVAVITGYIRARRYKQLASVSTLLGGHSNSLHHWRILRQIEAFFKKNDDFAEESVCLDAALSSFERGERICRITNRRLDYYYTNRDRLDPELSGYIARAERFLADALGSYSDFLDALPGLVKITSGATALTKRAESIPFMKLDRNPACTPQCVPIARALYRHYGYKAPRFTRIAWNRLEFVPKSWKTHRTIACEPAVNSVVQSGFDHYAKEALRRKGVNLSNQLNNRRHAKQGSIDGSFATIDLSMASDTVAYNTVAWLLPREWFGFLDAIRSPLYKHPVTGEIHKYAKFSSMGNGATFGLETLLFLSFLRAVGSSKGLAYGDDLTIEPELAPSLFKLLKFFGFVPNVEKSFVTGPFRESCGGDYYEGTDITPFYVRSTRAWDKPYACHNVNGLARISTHGELWEYLAKFRTKAKLPFTPYVHNTQAGVFIHPHHAYQLKLIRTHRDGYLISPSYSRKRTQGDVYDSRGLAVWQIDRLRESPSSDRWVVPRPRTSVQALQDAKAYALQCGRNEVRNDEDSRYDTLERTDVKFRRRWARWNFPAAGAPVNAFAFSELLVSPNG